MPKLSNWTLPKYVPMPVTLPLKLTVSDDFGIPHYTIKNAEGRFINETCNEEFAKRAVNAINTHDILVKALREARRGGYPGVINAAIDAALREVGDVS